MRTKMGLGGLPLGPFLADALRLRRKSGQMGLSPGDPGQIVLRGNFFQPPEPVRQLLSDQIDHSLRPALPLRSDHVPGGLQPARRRRNGHADRQRRV